VKSDRLNRAPQLLRKWARTGYLKSVVRCSDEDALLVLQAQAQSLNLCARSIQDAFVALITSSICQAS
jgi:PTH2 family peptidyl-tRNA hydrolase